MTSSFPPGVRLPGDGDRAAQHHPVSGQCPPPPAARRGASAPAPHSRGAPATGHGDAQQRQAVRGRGARPAGAETGPGGRPGGPRLHTHPRLSGVPQVPGPAGAAVSRPQRGEPGVGEDHQQQRARVAWGAPDTCRPGGEAGGPAGGGVGGAALRGEPRLVQRPCFSPEPGSRNLTERAQSLPPQPEPAPRAGSWGHPETLHPRGEGTPSLPTKRTHLLPVGLSLPPELQSLGWGSLPRPVQ